MVAIVHYCKDSGNRSADSEEFRTPSETKDSAEFQLFSEFCVLFPEKYLFLRVKLTKMIWLICSCAAVVELVDTQDLKSCSFGSVGSIPTRGTTPQNTPSWTQICVPYSTFCGDPDLVPQLAISNLITYIPWTIF